MKTKKAFHKTVILLSCLITLIAFASPASASFLQNGLAAEVKTRPTASMPNGQQQLGAISFLVQEKLHQTMDHANSTAITKNPKADFPVSEPYELIPLGVGNQNSYSSGGSSGGYSGGSYGGGYGGGGSLMPLFFFMGRSPIGSLGIIIVLIVLFILFRKFGGHRSGNTNAGNAGFAPQQPAASFQRPFVPVAPSIQQNDPNFSEEAFLSWAREVFITLNVAWTKQDWKMIRPFESEELFREHSQQLDEYIRNGTVNYLERVAVKDSYIDQFYTDQNHEYIVVKMRTNMIDYVQETATGKVTAGSKTKLWDMIHTLTFMRTKGTKTPEHPEELHATNCPNCGAPTEITSAGECEYCHSVITSGEFNWVLCKFTGENL